MSDPSGVPVDPYLPRHGDPAYRVEHYDLQLSYRPQGNQLEGVATVTVRAQEELSALVLDLSGLRVTKTWLDGAPVRFGHRGTKLALVPGRPVAPGETLVARVKYAGRPRPLVRPVLGEAGWEELSDGVIVAAQPHGAPTWFPCNDRVDDKATYTATVTAPADYVVAFSGALLGQERSGASRTWRFEQAAPMATYLATLQIGRYVTVEQEGPVPMRLLLPAGTDPVSYRAGFGRLPQMMAFFSARFGPYPFAGYTTVVTEDPLEIPLESQSLVTFGRNFLTGDWDDVRLVAHELAHQWFGNAVTARRWRHIWLHEGFACYAEWLWSEESGGPRAQDWAARHHARLRGMPQDLLLGDPGPADMFDDRVYKRGALTLHALRSTVGDEVFFDLLRGWVQRHAGGSVGTEDFLAHCAEVAGQEAADLVASWVGKRALPDLPRPVAAATS